MIELPQDGGLDQDQQHNNKPISKHSHLYKYLLFKQKKSFKYEYWTT